jgi:hypothetical protein
MSEIVVASNVQDSVIYYSNKNPFLAPTKGKTRIPNL